MEKKAATVEELQAELFEGYMKQAGAIAFCMKFIVQTAATDPQKAEEELAEMLPHVHPELMPLVEVIRGHIFLMRRTQGSRLN